MASEFSNLIVSSTPVLGALIMMEMKTPKNKIAKIIIGAVVGGAIGFFAIAPIFTSMGL